MSVHQRRLKRVVFAINGTEFQCQLNTWNLNNNTDEGTRQYTFCDSDDDADGQFVEDADPAWTLDLTFFADWRSEGISDFLWTNRGAQASVTIDHHPDVVGEHKRFTVSALLRAPSVGGVARATEQTQVTLTIAGEPEYEAIA